jgi:hypothetical protein
MRQELHALDAIDKSDGQRQACQGCPESPAAPLGAKSENRQCGYSDCVAQEQPLCKVRRERGHDFMREQERNQGSGQSLNHGHGYESWQDSHDCA